MKTAVEWLVANLDIDLVDSDWYIEQAKEMEKQQIINPLIALGWTIEKAEKYYNEIFKQQI